MGWCDNPNSAYYNRLVKLSFEKKAEKLYLKKNSYDLILVLNHNMKPVIKNKGSAIFLHIANKKFNATKGCVAIAKRAFIKILPLITKKTHLFI